jgi:PAS domain S-box-containing protein
MSDTFINPAEQKERILESIFAITQSVLDKHSHYEVIPTGLAQLGEVTLVDRVYYWENNIDAGSGQWLTSQIFEWCGPGVSQQIDNSGLQNLPFDLVFDFLEPLKSGLEQNVIVSDLTPSKSRQLLEEQEIVSLLALPVMVNDQFWGFVGFDDCSHVRFWSEIEISLLKSYVSILAKAIERNLLENNLIRTRQNFMNFFDSVNDLCTIVSTQGIYIHVNNVALNKLNYSYEEIIGKPYTYMYNSIRHVAVKQQVKRMSSKSSGVFSIPVADRSGREYIVETRYVLGEWNDQPAWFCLTKDLSEIRKSEEKFSRAFHAGGAMMIISRQVDDVIIDVNCVAALTLGYKHSQMCGRKLKTIGIDLSRLQTETETVRQQEIQITDARGNLRTGICDVQPIEILNTNCYLTTITDITERKVMEEELLRTRHAAEAASRAKSNFLSSVSHELRTPLNAIIAYAELIKTGAADTNDNREYAAQMADSAELLLNLINDLLDFSRMEAGRSELNFRAFTLRPTVDQAMKQIRAVALNKQIKLSIDIADDIPETIVGDSLKIQQILINLLNNAIKFTEQGSVGVTVRLLRRESSKITLQFTVRDTGIGMSDSQMSHIFEPFQQAGPEISARYGGTGLGLSISRNLAEQHGGTIWLESSPGQGTTISFTAVFDEPDINKIEKSELTAETHTLATEFISKQSQLETATIANSICLKLDGIRVLAVDDNTINQKVISALLANTGITLDITSSGREALTAAAQKQYDLILMDIIMPEMDGYKTSRKLREIQGYSHTPIIAVTADQVEPDSNKFRQSGLCSWIAKPLHRDKLLEKMISCLQRSLPRRLEAAGINYQRSIERFGQDFEFYSELLEHFIDDYRTLPEEINKYSTDRNSANMIPEDFLRRIHSLKGSAGELGADELSQAASIYSMNLKTMAQLRRRPRITRQLKSFLNLINGCRPVSLNPF